MQAIEIAAKIRLAVEVDVESEKVGEVRLEVLGRGEVGVAHERLGIDALGDVDQVPQEGADARRPVPADDVRRDLVADEIPRQRRMSHARVDRFGDGAPDVLRQLRGVEEADVLGPRDTGQHAQPSFRGKIEQPPRGNRESPERVRPELGHEIQIGADDLPAGELGPEAVRGEGTVGESLQQYLLGSGKEELAPRLELAPPLR